MSQIAQIKQLIHELTPDQQAELLAYLKSRAQRHPLEQSLNIDAEAILDALSRADELIIRNIRGVIAEAAFGKFILPRYPAYTVLDQADAYSDYVILDAQGIVRIQVKLQRSERQQPKILGNGYFAVEVQRTRTGLRKITAADEASTTSVIREKTRPYRPGQFDVLAVCMYPATGNWSSFLFTVSNWLIRHPRHDQEIKVIQPVPRQPNADWTDDLDTCVGWLRSDMQKTIGSPPPFRGRLP